MSDQKNVKVPLKFDTMRLAVCLWMQHEWNISRLDAVHGQRTDEIIPYLKDHEFNCSKADPNTHVNKELGIMITLTKIDILLLSQDSRPLESLIDDLTTNFNLVNKGEPESFAGSHFGSSNEMGTITGPHVFPMAIYINSVTRGYQISSKLGKLKTPMVQGFEKNPLTECKYLDERKQRDYDELMNILFFISQFGRPDITFPVSFLFQFKGHAKTAHFKAASRIIHYLDHTRRECLILGSSIRLTTQDFRYKWTSDPSYYEAFDNFSPMRITVLVDSLWAVNEDYTSRHGYIILLNGEVFAWESYDSKKIICESAVSYYVSITRAMKRAMGIKRMLIEIGHSVGHINLCLERRSVLKLCTPHTSIEDIKHVDLEHWKVRRYVEEHKVKLQYIKPEENVARIMTRTMDPSQFDKMKCKMEFDETFYDFDGSFFC